MQIHSLNVQVGIYNTSNDRIAISLGDLRATSLGVDIANVDLSNVASAQAALSTLDTALNTMNQYRSDYGAIHNRLDSALTNLEIYRENIAGAESRIRDADYAFETAEMNKYNIMQQAGVAILSRQWYQPRCVEAHWVNTNNNSNRRREVRSP